MRFYLFSSSESYTYVYGITDDAGDGTHSLDDT